MAVNLRPHSQSEPLWVEEETYRDLVARKTEGWSRCADEVEWLAKLHYLREGLKAGKMARPDFIELEARLVEGWLRRGN